jgi:replication factor A1
MDIIQELQKKLGKTEADIRQMVEERRKQLDFLISEEGAVQIIASESGISHNPEMKVSRLGKEMSGIEIFLKISEVNEKREFEKNGKKGRVRNFTAEDETGKIRLSLWDEMADLEIKQGDIVKITGGYTSPNLELRAGKRAKIDINPSDAPEELEKISSPEKQEISGIKDGDDVRIRGVLTKVFDRSPFFSSPQGKQLMLSATIDDGTAAIRAVFFRKAVEAVVGMTREEALEKEGEVLKRAKLFTPFWFTGKVKHSKFSGSDEIIVNEAVRAEASDELDKKINEIIGA